MARENRTRRLSPLPSGKLGAKEREFKVARLTQIMRDVALAEQGDQAQVFHPIRAVSRHFHVSEATVQRVYKQLEHEGLLSQVRGSKTLLHGFGAGRQLSVAGFVGLPASIAAFVTFQDYRTFFIRMRRELRVRGFAVVMVLFGSEHIETDQLFRRIEKHNFDTVLWYRPDTSIRDTLGRLKDAGLRVVGIGDGGLPTTRCRYEIRRETAIKTILRDWQTRSGITSVVVARGARSTTNEEEAIQALLEEEKLSFEFQTVTSTRPDSFLEECSRAKNTGLILPSRPASMIAFRAPEALMNTMSRCRVAFTGGPPSIVFAQALDVPMDLVLVDWQLIAEQVVNDLISKRAFERGETTAFEATAAIRVPLNQYAQSL
jgi:hypothetical protein